MILLDQLADILNDEINENFIESMKELWDDGDAPFDPEHPDMEPVLEKICERINEIVDGRGLNEDGF